MTTRRWRMRIRQREIAKISATEAGNILKKILRTRLCKSAPQKNDAALLDAGKTSDLEQARGQSHKNVA